MIRSYEKTQSSACLSDRASQNGRIPIFAVSASLIEKERVKYVEAGFDGWILKPVDFKRVELLLKGIIDGNLRNTCLYEPGKWEQGGWFVGRQNTKSMYETYTTPSEEKPTQESERMIADGRISDPANSDGSVTPTPQPIDSVTKASSNS